MQIIKITDGNYKNNIMRKNDIALWCTCAEINQNKYLDRIEAWFKQVTLLGINADLYVFVDGDVICDLREFSFYNTSITFITFTEPLGRESTWIFPGWKRSLYYAMFLGDIYDKVIHLENDVLINERSEFITYAQKDGITAFPYNSYYGFVESSCMILNDSNVRSKIRNYFYERSRWFENYNLENRLMEIIGRYTLLGESYRHEGYVKTDKLFVECQCTPEYILERL